MGHERASLSLQEVEETVDADMGGGDSSADHSPSSAIEEREGDDASDRGARQGSPTKRAGFMLGGERQGTGGRATAAAPAASGATGMEVTEETTGEGEERGYRLPDGQLGRLLGNERLAHEILVNPEFQVRPQEAMMKARRAGWIGSIRVCARPEDTVCSNAMERPRARALFFSFSFLSFFRGGGKGFSLGSES